MKYKCIVLSGVLLLLINCASMEPARVENGIYINPAYQFSLYIPAGWKFSEEMPALLSEAMPVLSREKFKAVFYDLNNKCFILVAAEKTEADMLSLKLFSDKFIIEFDKVFAKEERKYLDSVDVYGYRYEIYKDKINNCDSVCVISKVDYHFQDLIATGHNILLESHYGKLYSITLILVAREESFTNSLGDFNAVVDSIQRR